MTRRDAVMRDIADMRVERLRLIAFIKAAIPQEAAIAQRRIDKIEERFAEAGLTEDGIERNA